jgi:hypothetical protein
MSADSTEGEGTPAAEASVDEAAAAPATEEAPAEPPRPVNDDAAQDWWHDGPEPALGATQ